jgi:hypothetical protein
MAKTTPVNTPRATRMMIEVRATEYASSRQGISKTMASGIPQFSSFHKPERRGRARCGGFLCSIFDWKSGSSCTSGRHAGTHIKFCLSGIARASRRALEAQAGQPVSHTATPGMTHLAGKTASGEKR